MFSFVGEFISLLCFFFVFLPVAILFVVFHSYISWLLNFVELLILLTCCFQAPWWSDLVRSYAKSSGYMYIARWNEIANEVGTNKWYLDFIVFVGITQLFYLSSIGFYG